MCWHCREFGRLTSGHYKWVPWYRESWAGKYETAYHYVHVSRVDPALVAYTASEAHGEADRQTRLAPGRYLTRFYGEVLTQKDVQYWCGKFKGENGGAVALKFASEPDDITWVYENGPHSCMAGSADGFATDGVHPASVYGAGDLAVAYIENGGKVTARAICWPAKHIYGRAYGDDHTLRAKLEAAGYRAYGYMSEFDGAQLLRIEVSEGLVCPYLDVGSGRRVEDNGKFLIIGRGHIHAESTNGCVNGGPLCPRCGERYDDDEGRYISDMDEDWCPDCVDYTSVCDNCDNRYTDEHLTHVERNGRDVCAQCLERWYGYCEVCEEYHPNDDALCEAEAEEEGAPSPTVTDDERQSAFL